MKKILIRTFLVLLFCIGLLITFVFCPSLLYAHKTSYKNFVIYHDQSLDENFETVVTKSFELLKAAELFDQHATIEICLNDGSHYPKMIESLMGPDGIRAFSNKVVMHGTPCTEKQDCYQVEKFNNEQFPVSQFLSHAFVHCLQYNKYGFFKSNPVAAYDDWKWEGYAEFFTFGTPYSLSDLIETAFKIKKDQVYVELDNHSKTTVKHLKYAVLMKYCIEIKKMNYGQILKMEDSEAAVYKEMLNWYTKKQSAF